MNLYTILKRSADAGLDLQDESGAMPAGHNGPWNDEMTPVRNTAHWTIIFLKVYEITGEMRFLEGAKQCLAYITSSEARPHGATFFHRKAPEKDSCNGLIGQAWTIEALTVAAGALDEPDLVQLAAVVFSLHPFDDTVALWKTVDNNGSNLGTHMTMNQQVWFAAAGSLLAQNDVCPNAVRQKVSAFLDELATVFATYDSGLIRHHLKPRRNLRKQAHIQLQNVRQRRVPKPIVRLYRPGTSRSLREKAIGYHSFNLYGLSLLYESFPDHSFWTHDAFTEALDYAQSKSYFEALEENPYGYPYNVSGIELSYAYHTFSVGDDDVIRSLVAKQLSRHFDDEDGLLSRRTPDSMTLAARLYEATRLPNIQLDL